MITLFTIPKAFTGHSAVIQRNALASWRLLLPACQIILCGNDAGVAEAAAEYGAKHIPDINRNSFGTPLLNSAFERVAAVATHRILCYVNADIILLSDFTLAIAQIKFRRFLMVGQRWDVDITSPRDFAAPDWDVRLQELAKREGHLQLPYYIDYFVFPREDRLIDLPDFAVGRPGWDNWFIFRARSLKIPVIDATQTITVIHQNHDYRHVKQKRGNAWEGPEADQNRALVGGYHHIFDIGDATHLLTPRGVVRALSRAYLKRRLSRLSTLSAPYRVLLKVAHFISLPYRALRRIARLLRQGKV